MLLVAMKRRGAATVLADLRQEGCLKARFPRAVAWADVVTLNTSGGIAGGDRLEMEIVLAAGTRASIASQAAERFYRVLPGEPAARLRTQIEVAEGAAAEWLPQESILFDGSALDRALDVNLAEDACFLGVESLLFGRAAMGEQVRQAALHDVIRLRRGGELFFHDAIRLHGDVAALLQRPAVAAGGRAVATMIYVAPDALERTDALRAAFASAPAEAGASAWNGMLVGRMVAADGASLRATIVAGLTSLRAGRPLPRVWLC
jgi:urease accessory protein